MRHSNIQEFVQRALLQPNLERTRAVLENLATRLDDEVRQSDTTQELDDYTADVAEVIEPKTHIVFNTFNDDDRVWTGIHTVENFVEFFSSLKNFEVLSSVLVFQRKGSE